MDAVSDRVEKDRGKYEHPVEYEWHESSDHETNVDHTIGREGEPTILSLLRDTLTLGLLRSCNGTAGIFSSDTNSEEEPMMSRRKPKDVSKVEVIAAEWGLASRLGSKLI